MRITSHHNRDMLDRLFNMVLGSQAGDSDIQRQVVSTWNWPPWGVLLLLLAAVTLVLFVYWREKPDAHRSAKPILIALRIGLIGVLVLMMYGWLMQLHRTDLPDIVVAIDVSKSMATVDASDPTDFKITSRLEIAKRLLTTGAPPLLGKLQDRYRVRLFFVGQNARPQNQTVQQQFEAIQAAEPADDASRLGSSLRQLIQSQRGRPTAAILCLTDGVTTDGESLSDVSEYARRKSIPLYCVAIGAKQSPRDVRIGDVLHQRMVFVGDLVHFDVQVTGSGLANETVEVQLKRSRDGFVLDRQEIRFDADQPTVDVRLASRPEEEGEIEYSIEVAAVSGESDVSNNRTQRTLTVHDATLRVLLVQEYPSYEFRFLKDALSRGLRRSADPAVRSPSPTQKNSELSNDKITSAARHKQKSHSIELTTVLQQADADYVNTDETARRDFPVTREDLFSYDVLIFGDVNPSFLNQTAMENIAAFVMEHGGGLVFWAGPRHTPLAYRSSPLEELFPVKLATVSLPRSDALLKEGFVTRLSPLGRSSPHLFLDDRAVESQKRWNGLPELYWSVQAPELRDGARVLLEHPSDVGSDGRRLPIVCSQFAGAGQVIFHATDETYRWSRAEYSDNLFQRYWIQTVRYLSRTKLTRGDRSVELTASGVYRQGDSVPIQVRFMDAPTVADGVQVVVQHHQGRRHELRLQQSPHRRAVFSGSISELPEGRYRVWLAKPSLENPPSSASFQIQTSDAEQNRLELDVADLRLAAKRSRGKYMEPSDTGDLVDQLPTGRRVRIETLPPVPVWNAWIFPALFVMMIVSEWLLRKRVGLS